MSLPLTCFKAYDIRGQLGTQLEPSIGTVEALQDKPPGIDGSGKSASITLQIDLPHQFLRAIRRD